MDTKNYLINTDTLAQKGLWITQGSREKLYAALLGKQGSLIKAAEQTTRRYEGDFSTPAPQYPVWSNAVSAQPIARSGTAITAKELLEKWVAGRGKHLARSSVYRYTTSFQSLMSFFETRDVRTLTPDDMWNWMVHRRDVDGVKIEVINKNDRVAVSSIFTWAVSRDGGQLLPTNPLAGLERMKGVKTISEGREKTFREAEWRAILNATRTVPQNLQHPYATARLRYVPWLLAHTAARVSSITALTKDDVRQEGDIWVVDLKYTKTGKARSIPLHQQVIDEGFLTYVASLKRSQPLFCAPVSTHDPKSSSSPATRAANEIATWVHSIVTLPEGLSPNHTWRGTWKSRALGCVDVTLRDWIALHGARSIGRSYEVPTVAQLKLEAIDRFPRYDLS